MPQVDMPSPNTFIGYTYLHLFAALIIVTASSEFALLKPLGGIAYIVALIFDLILLFLILTMAPGPIKYILAVVYVAILGQFINVFRDKLDQLGVDIKELLFYVGGIFVACSAIGFYDKGGILGFGPYLFAALIGIVLGRIGLVIGGFAGADKQNVSVLGQALSWISIAVFSVYVAYDTQMLKREARAVGKGAKADYINSSIGLFLDAINLFSNVGDIIGE
jgi:FtsH-binding integral membrane protein